MTDDENSQQLDDNVRAVRVLFDAMGGELEALVGRGLSNSVLIAEAEAVFDRLWEQILVGPGRDLPRPVLSRLFEQHMENVYDHIEDVTLAEMPAGTSPEKLMRDLQDIHEERLRGRADFRKSKPYPRDEDIDSGR